MTVSKFEEELAQVAPIEQFKLYGNYGVVGKLHNFVKAVCASHKRRELFHSVFNDLGDEEPTWRLVKFQLFQHGGIRWHSIYLMLVRCSELRELIRAFQRKYWQTTKSEKDFHTEDDGDGSHYNPILDALSDDDWLEIDDLIAFSKVPYDLCKALEGSDSVSGFGSLWQTIISPQSLWQHYNAAANISMTMTKATSNRLSTMAWKSSTLTGSSAPNLAQLDLIEPCRTPFDRFLVAIHFVRSSWASLFESKRSSERSAVEVRLKMSKYSYILVVRFFNLQRQWTPASWLMSLDQPSHHLKLIGTHVNPPAHSVQRGSWANSSAVGELQ